jgi:DNA-binding MarR family transcriptional regulator
VNGSEAERFERSYRRIWGTLNRPDDPDLSQHERQLLHHVPASGGVALTWLARHLGLPKSTTSVLLKDLERRGFLRRLRDAEDERRLAVVLTHEGQLRAESDTVLEPARLAAALQRLRPAEREALLAGLELLAAAADAEQAASRISTARA